MDKITKQSYEEFPVTVDFSLNMATGETISSETITIIDNEGTSATSTMLSNPQDDGSQTASVFLSGGTAAKSPYKMTFKVVTSLSNKWEKDIRVKVKEI